MSRIQNSGLQTLPGYVWRKLKDNRQQELSMLMKELKAHIDTGKLTF